MGKSGKGKISRWQKISAIVPMAVLVGAWGAALTNTGFAEASSDTTSAKIPDVPATPFEQPASVQSGSGIDPKAGLEGTLSTLSSNGIPTAALSAYRRAEALLAQADKSCHLPWNLVAAIGRVESNHGRSGGNTINAKGITTPGIFGIALDGQNNTQRIVDTDDGALDNDRVYDRAVGPMQFLPSTWKAVGVDSDGDGKTNPQDIDDAAAAAGVYLCAGAGDLSTRDGAASAVGRYNHSAAYVNQVLAISDAYAAGDYTKTPNGTGASTVLTSREHDQSISAKDRAPKKKVVKKVAKAPAATGSGASTSASSGGSSGSGPKDSGGGSSTGGSGSSGDTGSSGTTSGLVGDVTGGGATQDPVADTLTWAQAKTQCLAEGISLLNITALTKCITDLLG